MQTTFVTIFYKFVFRYTSTDIYVAHTPSFPSPSSCCSFLSEIELTFIPQRYPIFLPVCDDIMSTFSRKKRQTRQEKAIVSGSGVALVSRKSVTVSFPHQLFQIRVWLYIVEFHKSVIKLSQKLWKRCQNPPPANKYSQRWRDHVCKPWRQVTVWWHKCLLWSTDSIVVYIPKKIVFF